MQYLSATLLLLGIASGIVNAAPEENVQATAAVATESSESRELGKKHHGGYIAPRPIVIAAPQKKGYAMPAPIGKKGGLGGYGGYGGYGLGGYGRYLQEEEIIEDAAIEDSAEDRELGKKHRGGYGYGYHQPIIVAAPQKKMPIMQPIGKKGGLGGYGGYGYGGYGGYGRFLQEEELLDEAILEEGAEDRELGKKHRGGYGYGYHQPIIVAAPQKKMPIARPIGKKGGLGGLGGYGGYGGYGYGGYGGYGRFLEEADDSAEDRMLKQQVHHKAPPMKMPAPITKKAPAPIKAPPMPITKKAPRPVHKKTVRTITKKAPRPAPVKKQPVQQFTKAARPVYYQRYHGKKGF